MRGNPLQYFSMEQAQPVRPEERSFATSIEKKKHVVKLLFCEKFLFAHMYCLKSNLVQLSKCDTE